VFVVKGLRERVMTLANNLTGYGGIILLSQSALVGAGRGDPDPGLLLARALGQAAGGLPRLASDPAGRSPEEVRWTQRIRQTARLNQPGEGFDGMLMSAAGGGSGVSDLEARRFHRGASSMAASHRAGGDGLHLILNAQLQRLAGQRGLIDDEQERLAELSATLDQLLSDASPDLRERLGAAAETTKQLLKGRADARRAMDEDEW